MSTMVVRRRGRARSPTIPGVDDVDVPATARSRWPRRWSSRCPGRSSPSATRTTTALQLLDLIEKKAKGRETFAAPAEEQPAEVVDLMAALEASVAAAKSRAGTDEEEAEQPRGRSRARTAKKG